MPIPSRIKGSSFSRDVGNKKKGVFGKPVERREARIKSVECEILNKLEEIMQAETVLS